MSKFSLMDLMNEESRKMKQNDETVYVSIYDIEPNEDNFYGIRDIEKLKESIILMNGVQENLILVKLPEGSDHLYKLLAGHRRREACRQLCDEGYNFDMVPATIKENLSEKDELAILLLTNSTQRGQLTDYEKVMEHVRVKDMLLEYKKEHKLEGKLRDMEAEYLGVSAGQISIYNKIYENLSDKLMELFKKGMFGISVAGECASCDSEAQDKLYDYCVSFEGLGIEDVKRISRKDLIKGQVSMEQAKQAIEEPPKEDIRTLIQGEELLEWVSLACSIMSEEQVNELIKICSETYTFQACNCQRVFEPLLPARSHYSKVSMNHGYVVEYIPNGEQVRIPIYYFWKGFKELYSQRIEELKVVPESNDIPEVQPVTVTESDPLKNSMNQPEEEDQYGEVEELEEIEETEEVQENVEVANEPVEKVTESVTNTIKVRVYKRSGMLYEEVNRLQDAYEYINRMTDKYTDIQQIALSFNK